MKLLEKNNHINLFYVWLFFLFIAILVFGRILNNFFVSDDFHWLLIAKDLKISGHIFLQNYQGSNYGGSYNPLLVLIFKFFYSLFHTNYFAYHLISILVHVSNAVLVYILSNKIFAIARIKNIKYISWLTAFVFLLYPVHVEAISWIAAWPHLWASLFYLLALIHYFIFKIKGLWKNFIYSLTFFVLALLTKEVAISLPFVVFIWEIYFYSINYKNKVSFPRWSTIAYFFIMLIFLSIRYLSTGLIFGTYSNHQLHFKWLEWVASLPVFGGDLFTFSFLRAFIYKGVYYYLDSVVIITLVLLALYFFGLLIKKKYLQFTVFSSVLFILAPFLTMGMHRATFTGERYLYLASVFFIFWLILLLKNIKINIRISKYLILIFFVIILSVVNYKLSIWEEATTLSRQIVNSYLDLNLEKGQKLIRVAMPDNLQGAEVFRNNLQQALELYYPDKAPEIFPTLAYVEVNKNNKNNTLLKWKKDQLGWFGESIDGSFVVTGITSISMNDIYWELWNYNYQNYKANIIRLIPSDDIIEKIKNNEFKILIFDRGVLRILQ